MSGVDSATSGQKEEPLAYTPEGSEEDKPGSLSIAERRAPKRCPSFLVRPALPAKYDTVVKSENHVLSQSITPIAASMSSRSIPDGLYSLMQEMRGVEGNSCANESREVERGRSREGATIDSESSSDQRRFADTGASAVGEAGQEDPTVGSDEVEAAEEVLVAAGKNEVMGAEGSVILVVPERTTHGVGRMQLAAVHTSRGVGAWKPFASRRNRGIHLRKTLTTLCQGLMMILGVGAMAQRTEWTWRETGRLRVTPESASGTERNACVHTSRGNCPGHPCHRDGMVGKPWGWNSWRCDKNRNWIGNPRYQSRRSMYQPF